MARTRIFLLRHGEINPGPGPTFVGQRDLPLTEEGIRQAEWWRAALKEIEFSAVYCSDLQRCVQTAQIVAGPGRPPLEYTPQFREIRLGEWEGVPVNEIRTRFPDDWRDRYANLGRYVVPGGESFADLGARVIPMFEKLAAASKGDVLITAHSGVNRVILCHTLGAPVDNIIRISQDYACLNVIVYEGASPHVQAMNLRPGPRGPVRPPLLD
jgi:alpha-ribazole phosphatase